MVTGDGQNVRLARQYMREGAGMAGAARRLGLFAHELDLMLWRFIDVSDADLQPGIPRRPTPMF